MTAVKSANHWLSIARQVVRGIWFRATIFTLAGVALALLADALSWILPENPPFSLGQGAVASILEIVATSMLAVTTFSLTAMVSAYSGAAQSGTPRSTQLLITDSTSQNALSTFVGAFAFAIVGIVALSMGTLSDTGRTVLFLGTLIVITIVLLTLLRWVAFLTTFGRMADIIDRVERAATESMNSYTARPFLGGSAWRDPPPHAVPITADEIGFMLSVDVATLQSLAKRCDARVWVARRPGERVAASSAVAYVDRDIDESTATALRSAFVFGAHRTFEQDPRIGLIALSEICSRALSPGINDPGTAIEVFSAMHRVLHIAVTAPPTPHPQHDRVFVPRVLPSDMVTDLFRPSARDGAGILEVMVRLQYELGGLLRSAEGEWYEALRHQAVDAMARGRATLAHGPDLAELERAHETALAGNVN